MRTLLWSRTFLKSLKSTLKKHPESRKDIEETLRLLAENPFAASHATHKLKGKLSESWACSVGYDMRIVFDFIKDDSGQEDAVFLIEIGTHDEVY